MPLSEITFDVICDKTSKNRARNRRFYPRDIMCHKKFLNIPNDIIIRQRFGNLLPCFRHVPTRITHRNFAMPTDILLCAMLAGCSHNNILWIANYFQSLAMMCNFSTPLVAIWAEKIVCLHSISKAINKVVVTKIVPPLVVVVGILVTHNYSV